MRYLPGTDYHDSKPDAFDDKFVAWAKRQQQKREKK